MALPTLITVHGKYIKLDGTPEQGLIHFQSNTFSLDSDSDTVMVPDIITAYLDPTGSVLVTLPATNDPDWNPQGWTYTFTAQFSHSFYSFDVVIPYNAAGGLIGINELVPAQVANSQLYAAYSHTHNQYLTIDSLGDAVDEAVADSLGDFVTDSELTAALATKASVSQLNTKANITSPTFTGTVAGITKTMVGLSAVDNTADADKPVSSAQQTALNDKANTSHTHVISDVPGLQTELNSKQPAGNYATSIELGTLTTRVDDIDTALPVMLTWNGTSYVENNSSRIYVGPNDPGSVPDGSIWIGY